MLPVLPLLLIFLHLLAHFRLIVKAFSFLLRLSNSARAKHLLITQNAHVDVSNTLLFKDDVLLNWINVEFKAMLLSHLSVNVLLVVRSLRKNGCDMLVVSFFENHHILMNARETIGLPDLIHFVFKWLLAVLHWLFFDWDFLLIVWYLVLMLGKPSSCSDDFVFQPKVIKDTTIRYTSFMIFWIGLRNYSVSWDSLCFDKPFLIYIGIFTEVLIAWYHWLSSLLSWIKTLIQAHMVNIILEIRSWSFLGLGLVYNLCGIRHLVIYRKLLLSRSLALASFLTVSSTIHLTRDCTWMNKGIRGHKGYHLVRAFLIILVLVSLRGSFRTNTDPPSLRPSLRAMALIHYYLWWF